MSDFSLILRPVITEKATSGETEGKYQFFVRKHATKIAIKQTFLELYGVRVAKVNVIKTASKSRTGKSRKPVMKKPEFKKVIITTKGRAKVDIGKIKAKS